MTKEQEDALLDDPKPAQGYAKLTIRDCIMRRFAKVATPTWEALCQLEAGEISKGKALQIILEEAERMERENFPEMETELQQLRLAADGMRELAVSFQGLLDKAQVAPGVQPGSDTFTRYNITTNGRDLERMKELIQSKIAAYRAAGEGLPKDTGTSRE